MVADFLRLTHRNGVALVGAGRLRAHVAHAGTKRGLPLQVQAKFRWIDQALAMEVDGVAKSSLPSGKNKHDLSVGRGDLQGVLAGTLRIRDARGGEGKQDGEAKRQHSFSGSNSITKADLAPTGLLSGFFLQNFLQSRNYCGGKPLNILAISLSRDLVFSVALFDRSSVARPLQSRFLELPSNRSKTRLATGWLWWLWRRPTHQDFPSQPHPHPPGPDSAWNC